MLCLGGRLFPDATKKFEDKIDWDTGPVRRCKRCDGALHRRTHKHLGGYCGHCTRVREQNGQKKRI